MTDGVQVDFSQVNALAADLTQVPGRADALVRKAVEVSARHVKDDWNADLFATGHASRTRGSIDYEMKRLSGFGAVEVSAEIGANRGARRQAGVVEILEYGTPRTPGRAFGSKALHAAEEDFERGLTIAAREAMEGKR